MTRIEKHFNHQNPKEYIEGFQNPHIYISEIFTISHPFIVPVSAFIRGQLKLNFYGIFPMNFPRINPPPLQTLAARSTRLPSPLERGSLFRFLREELRFRR